MKVLLLNGREPIDPKKVEKVRKVLEAQGISIDTINAVPFAKHPARVQKCLDLVEQMSRMTRDGEKYQGDGTILSGSEDEDAEMTNDDAVETLCGLISASRDLAVNPPVVVEAELED